MLEDELRQNVEGFMHPQDFKSFFRCAASELQIFFFRCSAEANETILRIFVVSVFEVQQWICQQPVGWKHLATVSRQCCGQIWCPPFSLLYPQSRSPFPHPPPPPTHTHTHTLLRTNSRDRGNIFHLAKQSER